MTTDEELKRIVREKYTQIADQSYEQNASSCCGAGCGCSTIDEAVMAEDYSSVNGYVAEADLGLGCGIPTQFADMKPGQTVIDLGSGAGNDAFVARSYVGAEGKVIGIDFTEKMIEKARLNAEKMGFNNVEFRQGDIEQMPIGAGIADVVISNCVLNLVPNKKKAFTEMYRVIKPGGHFSVSDIVLKGELPEGLTESAEMYAGCVAGAIQKDDYIDFVRNAGFVNVTIQKERAISIPPEILSQYLKDDELQRYESGQTGIYSITVYAEKPLAVDAEPCCGPGCCN